MPWYGMIIIGFGFLTFGVIQWGHENMIEKRTDVGTHTYEIRDLDGRTILITKDPTALNKHYKIVKKKEK